MALRPQDSLPLQDLAAQLPLSFPEHQPYLQAEQPCGNCTGSKINSKGQSLTRTIFPTTPVGLFLLKS